VVKEGDIMLSALETFAADLGHLARSRESSERSWSSSASCCPSSSRRRRPSLRFPGRSRRCSGLPRR
jgi:hypothetical protein